MPADDRLWAENCNRAEDGREPMIEPDKQKAIGIAQLWSPRYLTAKSPDGKVLILDVPDVEVYEILEIWLASFFPIQELCLRTFEGVQGIATIEAVACFRAAGQRQWTDAFVQRLRELGWIEGRTVAIEYRSLCVPKTLSVFDLMTESL